LDEDVLRRLLDVARVAKETQEHPADSMLVAADEGGEGVDVACAGELDQPRVLLGHR
jgi:hypothetical protein